MAALPMHREGIKLQGHVARGKNVSNYLHLLGARGYHCFASFCL